MDLADGLITGFSRALSGAAPLGFLLAAGLWAGASGRAWVVKLPVYYGLGLAVGMFAGMVGIGLLLTDLPAFGLWASAGMILFGGLLAGRAPLGTPTAALLVFSFGLGYGVALAPGIGDGLRAMMIAAGLVTATTAGLALTGLVVMSLRGPRAEPFLQAAGVAFIAAGLVLLAPL